MSDTIKIIVICAIILPVVGGLLARSQNPRIEWIAKVTSALGKLASFLLGLIVLLVLVLIVYLAWQFSK